MGAYDGYKYAKKKGYKGWKMYASIAGGAALGVVNPFKVFKVAKTGYKTYKAIKYSKKARAAYKATKVTKKAKAKPKSTVVMKKNTKAKLKSKPAVRNSKGIKKLQKSAGGTIGCFTAGTKIHTKDGFKAIETIKAGDYVWSENPETHEKALKKVKKIFVREKDSVVRLSINGEAIETTNEHPFYVQGHGWTNASELKVGDKVRLEDGTTGTVEKAKHVKLDIPVTVYNFEVEDFHTYYVSEQKVLVHNTCAMTEKNTSQNKYTVGAYHEIKGTKGMDAHHVGQKAIMKKLVANYDEKTAPAILVPREGHTVSKLEKGVLSRHVDGNITNARDLIARDIHELRRVYPDIPNSSLRQLIDMNKRLYPEVRKIK